MYNLYTLKRTLVTRCFLFILFVSTTVNSQAQVGIGTSTPAASALLEVSSTSKGFLPPRLTYPQRNAITAVEGLMIYNTESKRPNYYDGTGWKYFDGSSAAYGIGAINQEE